MKACKNCLYVVKETTTKCPICGGEEFTELFEGLIVILDPESEIAKLSGKGKGTWAVELKE